MNNGILHALGAGYNWLCRTEGSTRGVALVRMAIVVNAWARWSDEHVLYRNLDPEALIVAFTFFVSSTLTFFGLFTRFAAPIFAATAFHFVYVSGFARGHEPYTHHHTVLLAWAALFVALTPSGKSLSIDRLLALKRAQKEGTLPPPEVGNLWGARLMVLQLSSVYFWGAIDKTYLAFANGARMSHYLMNYYTGPTELADYSSLIPPLLLVMGTLTIVLEFGLSVGLFFKAGRKWLMLPGLLLHGLFYFTLSVFTFSTTMWALYIACFDPEEVDRTLERLLPSSSGQ